MEEQEQVRFSDAFKIEVNVGAKGVDGVNGKSAFELWQEQTNDQGEQPNKNKSEQDFLTSLKGERGTDGKSAYELWREKSGNENKSEEDFFKELKGDKGDSVTFDNLTEEQINSLVDKVASKSGNTSAFHKCIAKIGLPKMSDRDAQLFMAELSVVSYLGDRNSFSKDSFIVVKNWGKLSFIEDKPIHTELVANGCTFPSDWVLTVAGHIFKVVDGVIEVNLPEGLPAGNHDGTVGLAGADDGIKFTFAVQSKNSILAKLVDIANDPSVTKLTLTKNEFYEIIKPENYYKTNVTLLEVPELETINATAISACDYDLRLPNLKEIDFMFENFKYKSSKMYVNENVLMKNKYNDNNADYSFVRNLDGTKEYDWGGFVPTRGY